jgi:arylsulfatase A-like enzyme
MLDMAGLPVPSSVEGRSLLPLLEKAPADAGWREYTHGEHGLAKRSTQFLTDGREKYIWFTHHGREQLFDLQQDPQETRDLAGDPDHRERLECWRSRLVKELAPRTEDGMSDGKRLIPGTMLESVRPALLEDQPGSSV